MMPEHALEDGVSQSKPAFKKCMIVCRWTLEGVSRANDG
jgi:hypothetical protein